MVRRLDNDRQTPCASDVDMSTTATANSGQLNAAGSTWRTASGPPGKARIASAMNTHSASRMPAAQDRRVKRVSGTPSRDCVTSVPHTTISDAMHTGASTGPHQGSGKRKRMSQSNREAGHPDHVDHPA